MHVLLESILMPGALHDDNSCFISVFYKDDYHICIMVEDCKADYRGNKFFEYHEHAISGKTPSKIDLMFNRTLEGFNSREGIPDFIHNDQRSLVKKINALKNIGYIEVFSGEQSKEVANELRTKSIHALSRLDSHYENNHQIKNVCLTVLFENLGGVKPFDTQIPMHERNKHKTFAQRFSYALDQLNRGIYQRDKIINLCCNLMDNPGTLGNGCIRALIQALTSGNCSHLEDLTIQLDINHCWLYLNNNETQESLKQVINSPYSPLGLTIICNNSVISNSPTMEKDLEKYIDFYYCAYDILYLQR
jgi:hypothetical protein